MNPNLKCFHSVEKFSTIAKFLKDGHKQHRAFPIWNDSHHLIGMIPRNFMIQMIRYKNWYNKDVKAYTDQLDAETNRQL